MATVECRSIHKMYGTLEVMRDFNLHVNDHEFVVFLGPSGCGKSTMLRMIAGLEDISSGDLLIGGERMNDRDPGERGIAMVFQNYALYPHMSVRENIVFGLERAGVGKDAINARLAPVVDALGLEIYLGRKPAELSGGQQQRVAIARAIVTDPAVLLADEPTGNLDTKTSYEIMDLMTALNRDQGITIIMVTHEPDIARYARRTIRFLDGHIESDGAGDAHAV